MKRPARLVTDGGNDLGMTVREQERAVTHHVAGELVTVQIPLAGSAGSRDGQRKGVRQAHVVRHAARQHALCPGIKRGRTGILPRPARDDAAVLQPR